MQQNPFPEDQFGDVGTAGRALNDAAVAETVNARSQDGGPTLLTPTSQTQGGGNMNQPSILPDAQTWDVVSGGDAAAGGFAAVVDRTPTVKL